VYSKRSKLNQKGSKKAAAETILIAAKTIAAADMDGAKRLAAEFETVCGGDLAAEEAEASA
jgi:hypothetical protein